MWCPECRGEYREGFSECADCGGVALVESLPEPMEPEPFPEGKLVTVLESGDPTELAFAEAVLGEADIPFVKRGEGLQELFALGRLGLGFNPITGPILLQVPEEHADAAARLLEESEPQELEDLDSPEEPV
jgi:Putative prokaryotic signal transducing protein